MKSQRVMFQVKEQDKIKLKEQLNEVRGKASRKEFRMIVKEDLPTLGKEGEDTRNV